jgi:protocatechuate 3,4-dioxygenase beta subunit
MLAIAFVVATQVVTSTQTQPARPGTPARDTRPAATGTAVIRGRVFAADTGRPLRRARITVSGPELGTEPRQTSTNLEGRYELRDLPAGRFTLTVARAGYLQLRYGQRRPLEQAKPLQVLDKQLLDNIDFSLPRMSVITGRVIDEANEPVAGAQVMAMRSTYFEGRRRLVPAGGNPGGGMTDDAGQFRVLNLPPGTYYLRATMRDTWTVTENGVEQTFGYAPTYFPSTANVGEARRVTVGIGQEIGNSDIALIPGRAATVSGTAFDSHGRPLVGSNIGLTQETRGPGMSMMMGVGNSPVAADGSFIIRNVAPGEYKLMARAPGEKNGEAAALPILVNGIDIDNISLTTMAGGTISGVLVSETGGPPAAPRERMRVTLRAVNTDVSPGGIPGGGMDAGRVKDDWTFTLSDIYTASRLRVMLPDGWMVKAILYNDRDISESPIELRSGEELSNVQVVVSNKVTTLSGVLADAKGAPATDGTVIVFANDPTKWAEDSRFVRSVRPDQQGQYEIKGLPAGEYLAVAVDYVAEGMWNDPEYLEGLRRYAQRVTLTDGDARALTLKVTTIETQ